MTTNLEKRFFDTFGVEPKCEDACELGDEYWNNEHLANEYGVFDNYMEAKGCPINKDGCTDNCRHAYTKEVYPQITDRILLELIRLGLNYDFVIHSKSVEELKEKLLALLMYNEAEFKQQVQALFEEG